jgi:hypothetical protein
MRAPLLPGAPALVPASCQPPSPPRLAAPHLTPAAAAAAAPRREIRDVLMSLHGFVGTYCMAPWETFLIWSVFLLIGALACYGAYRQSSHLMQLGTQMLEGHRWGGGRRMSCRWGRAAGPALLAGAAVPGSCAGVRAALLLPARPAAVFCFQPAGAMALLVSSGGRCRRPDLLAPACPSSAPPDLPPPPAPAGPAAASSSSSAVREWAQAAYESSLAATWQSRWGSWAPQGAQRGSLSGLAAAARLP